MAPIDENSLELTSNGGSCKDNNNNNNNNCSIVVDDGGGGDGGDDPWSTLLYVEDPGFAVPVYGIISPIVIVVTVVTNSLVCIVLLKRHMRNPTNMLLVAMAISDTLTGLLPLPWFLYFYALGNFVDYVPYEWCFAHHCLQEYVPIIFHTASIWLTVLLAVHRYVCVCRPLASKKWCTTPNVLRAVVVVYSAAALSQVNRFVEYRYAPVVLPSRVDPGTATTACRQSYSPFVREHMNAYFNVYYWFRVVFIHLVPCTMLIVLNGLLVQTMRTAQVRRRQLLQQQNRKTECRRLAESNLTTLMLVVVVGVFLLVEFPLALLLIVMIVDNSFDLSLLDASAKWIAQVVVNLFILFSYPINFFIYCGMSRQFRDTFKGLFTGRQPQPQVPSTSVPNQSMNHENPYQAISMTTTQQQQLLSEAPKQPAE